nr:putative transposase, Ptta/En/Spm, plant [Tanacetum cinerariifolium]
MKNGAFITLKSERVAVFILTSIVTSIVILTSIFILIVFLDYPYAAYNGALVDKYGSDYANHPIYDDDLWKKYARDDMKGGVFGWGSMSDPQYTLTGTPSTTRCTSASSSGSKDVQEEVKVDLKEEMKVDLKEEMKADLKEEMKK